jgi:molybdenum cofactor synthesis domain-containing protein
MIPLATALAVVRPWGVPLAPATVPVADALGCVLAAPAPAALDVPPFANSAMDGYALRSADVADAPVTLEVVGRVLAGAAPGGGVGPGQAMRIMTGAPLPTGADAVCMVERTSGGREDGSGTVVIEGRVEAGENLRGAGGDVRRGEEVLGAGTLVGATQLAALLSAGCTTVTVHPRPRVGVVSTGDELVDAGLPLGPAQIYDSNRPMLLALAAEAGGSPVDLGRSPDDVDGLTERIGAALPQVDALVLSGGVSVGDVDVVRMALDRLGGGGARWMQIAIRPAKPFSCASLRGPGGAVPVFGLPGNPVSSAVSFELLVRPVLRAMAGHRVTERARWTARAAEPMRRRPDGRLHLVRVLLEPAPEGVDGGLPGRAATGWVARPCPGQGSHQIRSMGLADGLALVPDGEGMAEGAPVEVLVTNPALIG